MYVEEMGKEDMNLTMGAVGYKRDIICRCELPSTRYLQRCLHRTRRGEFVSIAIFYQKSVVLFWATLSLMQNRLRTEEFVKKIQKYLVLI